METPLTLGQAFDREHKAMQRCRRVVAEAMQVFGPEEEWRGGDSTLICESIEHSVETFKAARRETDKLIETVVG